MTFYEKLIGHGLEIVSTNARKVLNDDAFARLQQLVEEIRKFVKENAR